MGHALAPVNRAALQQARQAVAPTAGGVATWCWVCVGCDGPRETGHKRFAARGGLQHQVGFEEMDRKQKWCVLGLAGDASVRNRAKRGVLFNNSRGRPRTRPVAQKGDSQAPLKSTGPLPTVTVAIWSAFMALHPLLDRAPTKYWQDLPAGGHLTLEAVRLKALLMGK